MEPDVDGSAGLGPRHGKWGFPKIRGTCLEVLMIRTTVYWGLHWGLLIFGKNYLRFGECKSDYSVLGPLERVWDIALP